VGRVWFTRTAAIRSGGHRNKTRSPVRRCQPAGRPGPVGSIRKPRTARIAVTQQFVDQISLAVDLSQTRYQLGLGSIVELSHAQLQQTEAQIQFAAAKYQYQIAQAVLRFQIAAP